MNNHPCIDILKQYVKLNKIDKDFSNYLLL